MTRCRRVMFVTGTRAEFGLMEATLRRLRADTRLELQLVVTGMHLSREHGYSIAAIRKAGWKIDGTVPWRGPIAVATGAAMADLAKMYGRFRPDVVLVVGDRVEAFAAASAAHLAGCVVAHVHGGDRALGQVDDALRHAISKLAHVHFAATQASGRRLVRMGEDRFRIHVVGTPGLVGLPARNARNQRSAEALVLLHPDQGEPATQKRRAQMLFSALRSAGVEGGTIVYPNNDPGWQGIVATWEKVRHAAWQVCPNLSRDQFLGRLADHAFLVGNSSSGIIEAASVGTWVINIGDRQAGRERSKNVVDVSWDRSALLSAILTVWNFGRPKPFRGTNVYGEVGTADKIANLLAGLDLGPRLRQKLIAY